MLESSGLLLLLVVVVLRMILFLVSCLESVGVRIREMSLLTMLVRAVLDWI